MDPAQDAWPDDGLDQRPQPTHAEAVAEALWAAKNLAKNCGFCVFPCLGTKAPATPRGLHDASNDPAQIERLWRWFPGPLVGLRTGAVSGVDALDVDLKHAAALAWVRNRGPRLPRTRVYRTRSGGLHAVFRHAEGMRNSAGRPCPGIDVRGDNGYIIFWYAAGFECVDHSLPARWPGWLLAELRPPARPPVTPASIVGPDSRRASVDGLIRVVATAREGERNARLYWAGRRFAERISQGGISAGEAETMLMGAARVAGLPDREAQATVRSALRGSP